jgi:hypothetical protein
VVNINGLKVHQTERLSLSMALSLMGILMVGYQEEAEPMEP